MSESGRGQFVSRAGLKLQAALDAFALDVTGSVCADLGSNVGGFVDCLLQAGAAKVYAVEKGYGVVDFKLRRDARVIVKERADARLITLPESVDLVTLDVGWTRQRDILPAAQRLMKPEGCIISLIKPHYEAQPDQLDGGVLRDGFMDAVLAGVERDIAGLNLRIDGRIKSPITGQAGNVEVLWLLKALSTNGDKQSAGTN